MEARPLNPTLAALRGDYMPPESFWQSLNYYHLYRFVVATLFVVATIVPIWTSPFGADNPVLTRQASYAYWIVSLLIPIALLYWKPPFNFLLTAEVLLDIVALTLIMAGSGGNHSGVDYLLLVVVAAAGLVGQGRLTLFYASLATLAVLLEQMHRVLGGGGEAGDFTHPAIISIGFFATAITARLLARRVVANEALAQRRGIELANQLDVNQRVIRDMQDGVIVVDAGGKVLQYNPRASSLWGAASPQDASLEDFSPELASRHRLWRRSMTEVIETLRVPRSGRVLKVRFLPAGETGNALLYFEDTERIQAQAQQIKLAALGRLTASMAHEIRNPLAAISHASELLNEGQPAQTVERLARIIGDNALRLNRLVTDVVELGRRDRIQPEIIRVHEAIGVLVDELALTHAGLREIVDVDCAQEVWLKFDRGHLHRILTNLVENSLRYCKNRPGSVRIFARVDAVTGRVTLAVADDGPGVVPEAQEKLFEPFFTTRTAGTGLGLYIARELCEANDATLELVPSEKGACFRIVGKGV